MIEANGRYRLAGAAMLNLAEVTAADSEKLIGGMRTTLAQFDELLRWHSVMISRENRMLQLKAEVNELLARQGQTGRQSVEAASTRDGK